MQDESTNIDRRAFLRLGASGLAVAGSAGILPRLVAQTNSTRNAPVKPLVLRSSSLRVVLDPTDGLVFQYHLIRSGIRFRGDDSGAPLNVRLCRRDPWGFASVAVKPSESKTLERGVDFRFLAPYVPGTPAAEFSVRYTVEANTVLITLEDVREHDGFELISISMPSLVSLREQDKDAWLAHGDAGGDVTLLHDAKAGKLGLNSF